MKELKLDNAAVRHGRTIFLKSVTTTSAAKHMLQPASANAKLGAGKRFITKGKWKGMPMYSLTLEERKTCPKSCDQWRKCYGNNMPFAKRLDHRSAGFLRELEAEIVEHSKRFPLGWVLRLHVLGDFYSVAYVQFWERMLLAHPELRLFGYTHRHVGAGDGIGEAIGKLNGPRAWIRYSDAGGKMSANVEGEGITCPHQTGKTESCMTCGLCWGTTEAINFLTH